MGVHVATVHLLADLIDAVLRAVAAGDDDAIVDLLVFRRGQFNAHAQQRRQRRTGEDAAPVVVKTVFQPGVPGWIGADQVVKRERRRVL